MPISHVITYHFVLPALSEHMGVACRYCRPRLLHFFQLVYNMILVGLGVWLIIGGISTNISHDFWTGVCTLLAMATLRYIDLIGGYVGGAILFMMIAGILLGAAHYWKRYQLSEAQ